MTTPNGRTGGSRTGSPSDSIEAAASTVAVVGEGAIVSTAKSSRSKRRRRRKSMMYLQKSFMVPAPPEKIRRARDASTDVGRMR